ncbi:hypothetical protein NK918_24565, partial [Salmonella enterica subsp. enterica serovar Typhimurium]|uniref:hypothetical protein n=1 Tax=Salmonella enterica TaxID=28901 RepID=UPI0020A570CA
RRPTGSRPPHYTARMRPSALALTLLLASGTALAQAGVETASAETADGFTAEETARAAEASLAAGTAAAQAAEPAQDTQAPQEAPQ